MREGAAGRMIRESEDLSENRAACRIGEHAFGLSAFFADLSDEKGMEEKIFVEKQGILESVNQVRGFFFVCIPSRNMQGGCTMTAREQAYCKLTLFLLKDWDSFQIAMRGCLRRVEERKTGQRSAPRPGRK